jgi:hypothetical protein
MAERTVVLCSLCEHKGMSAIGIAVAAIVLEHQHAKATHATDESSGRPWRRSFPRAWPQGSSMPARRPVVQRREQHASDHDHQPAKPGQQPVLDQR